MHIYTHNSCIYTAVAMPSVNMGDTKHDTDFMYPIQDIPRQLNGSDCGVFVLQYAFCLLLNIPMDFSQVTCNKITNEIISTFIINFIGSHAYAS